MNTNELHTVIEQLQAQNQILRQGVHIQPPRTHPLIRLFIITVITLVICLPIAFVVLWVSLIAVSYMYR
jgi:hypothetical protein